MFTATMTADRSLKSMVCAGNKCLSRSDAGPGPISIDQFAHEHQRDTFHVPVAPDAQADI